MLGICVGMQMLFDLGVEHGRAHRGLRRSGRAPSSGCKADVLPHMGWNTVARRPRARRCSRASTPDTRFYFVHSYGVRRWELEESDVLRPPLVTWADHGEDFVAAVENGALAATQFHPEKSGDAGATVLQNWLRDIVG